MGMNLLQRQAFNAYKALTEEYNMPVFRARYMLSRLLDEPGVPYFAQMKDDTAKKIADAFGKEKLKETIIYYGKQTGFCMMCGHELRDPESMVKGIGPVCEKKLTKNLSTKTLV